MKNSLISGLISMVISMIVNQQAYPSRSLYNNLVIGGIAGFTIGTLIPTCIFFIQTFVLNVQKLKRLPYWAFLVVTILIIMVVTLTIYFLVGIFLFPDLVTERLLLTMAFGLSGSLSLLLTISNAIRQFAGPGVVSAIISGKYHRAFETKAVFVFIDLVSSTAMAEKMGSEKFFNLINSFHALVESCCYYYDGVVYKYLGDGAILVWQGTEREKPLQCLLEIREELKSNSDFWKKEFGEFVGFTAGVHCGQVITGEIGDMRREIGYWGDAVNTTARIQSACKEYKTDILISADFREGLPDRWQQKIKSVGSALLRGKEKPVDVYTIN
jgi:adenylate cyclase